nr:MAG TPA: hypothetical protein [Caudoviricetes sp.]
MLHTYPRTIIQRSRPIKVYSVIIVFSSSKVGA